MELVNFFFLISCNHIVCCLADVQYEITVYTGDVKSAGTDSAISMTLFGSEGTTPEFVLDKDESRFERGGVDLIRMDLDDVGKLLKARIAVDGKGTRPDWFLEKVFLFLVYQGLNFAYNVSCSFSLFFSFCNIIGRSLLTSVMFDHLIT